MKKNFNLIVISAVVLGGGAFAYTQMGGSAPQPLLPVEQVSDVTSLDLEDLGDLGDMPPVPIPVDASAEPIQLEMEGLDALLDQAPEALVLDGFLDDAGALTPMPALSGGASQELVVSDFLAGDTDTSLVADVGMPVQDVVLEEPMAMLSEVEVESVAMSAAPASVSSVDEQALSVVRAENADLLLEGEKREQEMQVARDKISGLEGALKGLRMDVLALNKSLRAAQVGNKADMAPKGAVSSMEKTSSQALPEGSVVKPALAPVRWTLRGAQPGRATISNVQTNDLRTIEVDDLVPGLGRITVVSVEKGRWVVRGTLGHVSQ